MAALAEYPERVDRLFLQKVRSPKGAYCVCLCICGVFQEFVIDDMFPVENERLVFSYTKEDELWVMLAEKAFAKAYGGFWNIGTGGTCTSALTDLTGAPSEYIDFSEKSDDSVFERLLEYDQKNYIMSCSSGGQGEVVQGNGIIAGHA